MSDSFKLVRLLLSLACISYSIQQEDDAAFMKSFDAINSDCSKQFGFSDDNIGKLMSSMTPFPTDQNLKCYFSCINIKLGVMDESCDIKEDVLKKVAAEFFNASVTTEITTDCDIPKTGDACQTAYVMMQCVQKASLT